MAEENLYVAREEDVRALRAHWEQVLEGKPQLVRLQAPFGGGRRAVAGEFLRSVAESSPDTIIWRTQCLDQENGLQWMVRMYGSLVATLNADPLRRGKIELLLNSTLPSQPKRVQGWYQEFIASLKEAKTDREKGAVQLRIPKDNPLIGLVEITNAIARKFNLVLEIQSPYQAYSVAVAQLLEAVFQEARESSSKLMILLHDEPDTDVSRALHPMPLLDLYQRRASEIRSVAIAPWGASETQRFLDSKGVKSDAGRIAQITAGRPGFIAELVDILRDRSLLEGDLSGVTLASLVPMNVDEEELEAPPSETQEGQRKHATAADLGRVAYLAALLGQAFPANLVADMGGFDRDSIDDLIDACGDLFEEVQFAEDLGTWIYKFKRGSYRDGVLEQNDTEEGHELARRVGLFMERFLVQRGYAFMSRTARVYAEHGAGARANLMRSLALSNDSPDVWGLAYDLIRYFDEVKWPEAMRRTVFMNLVDRLVASGTVQAAEQVHQDATAWASKQEDRELTAWLLYAGSRLDARRQDTYRARDRARDAIKLYAALGNEVRQAEIHNHLAGIELQDGNPNAALEHVDQALQLGRVEGPEGKKVVLPAVLANAEFVRGHVARRSQKLSEAAEHFRRANELAGQAGIAQLALDAGLAFGEALLASSQTDKARDILGQVVEIARQLRNPMRERSACELLAQAEGILRNYPAALQHASRTLELSKALRFEQAMPLDLYNLGYLNFASQKPTEALAFFRQAQERLAKGADHPVGKDLFYFSGLAHLQTGNVDEAKAALRSGLRPAQRAKDWRRLVSALDTLAQIEEKQGNAPVAKKLLADAIGFAEKAQLREERKTLRRRLDAIA